METVLVIGLAAYASGALLIVFQATFKWDLMNDLHSRVPVPPSVPAYAIAGVVAIVIGFVALTWPISAVLYLAEKLRGR